MINFTCPKCETPISAQEQNAGQSMICPNCSATVNIPAAAGATTQGQFAPTQIVVNVGGPAAQPGLIQKQVSMVLAVILGIFLPGVQYFYMGQISKGIVVLLLEFGLATLTFITCGIGSLIWIPFNLLILIDTIVVVNRMKSGPVSAWRCF
jgi:hypothetical protein